MNIKPGKYRHFKGREDQLYDIIGTAIHSETLEEYVVYKALYGEQKLWIRPIKMFTEKVMHEGKEVERFKFIE
ncbi:MAG: DUF1653 domain-containing protein [Candidatus Woesearchaeota archaeon]|jgi:hypothetical protein